MTSNSPEFSEKNHVNEIPADYQLGSYHTYKIDLRPSKKFMYVHIRELLATFLESN